ncbi:superoxide dismutase [Photobacterium kishitanii]|uniref:Superoxide dismutase [Cu-Zn] n=1 Tax=Photobacterium kishitanii TaxID=318456 RepID=A0AAX0YWH5_9GAMM|nr:superoxide dismutase family protein [Photobacterium kishitanii]KJG59096.1 superoxide dismutase [Photobacterium kishitanii]KJG62182.1 superoxide dismutase [Photobacterium kishitanii]KJG67288.1 superoxide dismutase [Photobacterium kishitanii]KJG70695.1 superoxide dismutase [Photobacterium kishitanii]PSX21516.1 superoxide dismutase [Photobacterium kishitanii]
MVTFLLSFCLFLISFNVNATDLIKIDMKDLNSGKSIGYITAQQSQYGVVFTPHLSDLSTGLHGFHLHENPSCEETKEGGRTIEAGAAGGHYDPMLTGKHGYSWTTDNHLGDLPPLYVDTYGDATEPVLAPRLKLADLVDRSLMVHAGGDNHADHPHQHGGSGARLVCGVITK